MNLIFIVNMNLSVKFAPSKPSNQELIVFIL